MSRLLALTAFEVREHRLLLAASAFLGLLALAAPVLPSLPAGQPGEVRGATALLVCALWTAALAVVTGRELASELADRAVGFYLARPLTTWTIWAGKLAAAVLLPFLAGVLVLLPAALAGGISTITASGDDGLLTPERWPLRIVIIVVVTYVVGIALGSRSGWLLLDLGAIAGGTALVAEALRVLREAAAPEAVAAGTSAFRAVALGVLLVAGAVAVHRGRGEPAAAHRALSLALWPPLLAGALGLFLFARWVVGAPIGSLETLEVAWTPRGGSWVAVGGEAAHRYDYSPLFLLETKSGRSVRLGRLYTIDVQLAADGSRAIWLPRAGGAIWTLDLATTGARPRQTGIRLSESTDWLALSPRGRRLAALERRRLLVFDVADGRLLASARLDTPATQARLKFLDDDRLRLVEEQAGQATPGRIVVRDLRLPEGRFATAGKIEVPRALAGMKLSPAGDRLLVHLRHSEEDGGEPGLLYALPRAELLTALPRVEAMGVSFLADGRIAVRERVPGGRSLRIFSRDGREERTFHFSGARGLQLGGQPAPGALVVAATAVRSASSPQGWTAYRLDLGSGRKITLGRGLLPASHSGNVGPAARLFRTSGALLVEIDEHRERRVLLPRRG